MNRREGPLSVESAIQYIREVAYDGAGNPIYLGRAPAGSLLSASTWQIQRLTFDGTNNMTAIRFANGSHGYTAVWDDRASYSYS